jgi:hypothetical protein
MKIKGNLSINGDERQKDSLSNEDGTALLMSEDADPGSDLENFETNELARVHKQIQVNTLGIPGSRHHAGRKNREDNDEDEDDEDEDDGEDLGSRRVASGASSSSSPAAQLVFLSSFFLPSFLPSFFL